MYSRVNVGRRKIIAFGREMGAVNMVFGPKYFFKTFPGSPRWLN
jgi:hypothetical protein